MKTIGKMEWSCGLFWIFVDGKFIEIISLKARGNHSASIWSIFFDLLIGGPRNPHFYDFGILGRVQTLQNQLFLSLETPGHFKKHQEKSRNQAFETNVFSNLKVPKIHFCQFRKRRAPGNDEDPFNKILKILDMRSISIKKHKVGIW